MPSNKTNSAGRAYAEQRRAVRHARSLRVFWRVLGNRDLCYGEARLKDIGTDGLAMRVNRACPKGTVVIVQFEGTEEPLLSQAAWSTELPSSKTDTSSYLLGCSFNMPLREKELSALLEAAKKAAAAPAIQAPAALGPVAADPYLIGGAHEKRAAARRGGLTVPVFLYRATGSTPIEAAVVDRSLKGLGIMSRVPFPRGSYIQVRPHNSHEKAPTVKVQIRCCRQKGKQWLLGCHFPSTAPANVVMLFG